MIQAKVKQINGVEDHPVFAQWDLSITLSREFDIKDFCCDMSLKELAEFGDKLADGDIHPDILEYLCDDISDAVWPEVAKYIVFNINGVELAKWIKSCADDEDH